MSHRATLLPLAAALFIGLLGAPVQAQTLPPSEQSKLAPRFQRLLSQPDSKIAAPASEPGRAPRPATARPVAKTARGTPVYSAYVVTERAETLRARGLTVTSTFPSFAIVRATPSALRTLAEREHVQRVVAPAPVRAQNDVTRAEVGATPLNAGAVNGTSYTGDGVLACVIDSGIDPSHPDFTGPDGETRIQFIWDQRDDSTGTPSPAERDPSRFGADFNPAYGAEYTASDINAGMVNQTDPDGHGTHVTGTLASSGRAFDASSGAKRYRGVAPEADIIAVKSGIQFQPRLTTDVVNGIQYCRQVAEAQGKPVVVNMSLGTQLAPHTGTGLFAQGIDGATDGGSAPGVVTVASAGNDGDPADPIHVSGTVAPGDSVSLSHTVTHQDTSAQSGDDAYTTTLWAYAENPYRLTVLTPSRADTVSVRVGPGEQTSRQRQTSAGTIVVNAGVEAGDRFFLIQVSDRGPAGAPAEGTWTVRLHNEGDPSGSGASTRYHGWDIPIAQTSSLSIGYEAADNETTIGTPAVSQSAIAVGAYVQRRRFSSEQGPPVPLNEQFQRDRIAPFSSRGPTVDGRQKPAVAAPGAATLSALSDDSDVPPPFVVGDGEHRFNAGTSMSSPAVAGVAALLLQQDPSLSTNRVRDLLMRSARTDAAVESRGAVPNSTFGAGRVSALKAMARLLGGSAQQEVLRYTDPWRAQREELARETVGDQGAERLALRFTPTQRGVVSGAYLTLARNLNFGADPANDLTDSLTVRVWSDDGSGQPDAPVGEPVRVAPERLTAFTPNHLDLRRADVAVEPGTDYHLVLEPKGGTLAVAGETARGTSERSLAFDGGQWSGTGSDLVVRPVISSASGVETTLPVELAGFRATATGDGAARLTWQTASETENAGFRVQHAAGAAPVDGAAWETLGFVEGAGTTAKPQTYRFRADDLTPGVHRFRLQQVDTDGTTTVSGTARIRLRMDDALRLTAPAPNPARRDATFHFGVREATEATVQVYDVLGRKVATLYDSTPAPGRMQTLRLDADRLPSGTYVVRLTAGGRSETRKVTIVH